MCDAVQAEPGTTFAPESGSLQIAQVRVFALEVPKDISGETLNGFDLIVLGMVPLNVLKRRSYRSDRRSGGRISRYYILSGWRTPRTCGYTIRRAVILERCRTSALGSFMCETCSAGLGFEKVTTSRPCGKQTC